jgi:putative heme transporter
MTPSGDTARSAERRGFLKRHRRAVLGALTAAAIAGFFYYVVPQIAGLGPTLRRLRAGNGWWLAVGVFVETLSIGGQVALLRGVFRHQSSRIGWRPSIQITLAGAAATKLIATAGAGGIAVTAWALRAAGLPNQDVANGIVCFDLLNYAVYMAALAIAGLGLWFGVFAGPAPVGVTLIPALFGLGVIAIVLSMTLVEGPLEGLLERRAERSSGRQAKWWHRAATVPRALHAGIDDALAMVRRRDPGLLGALAGWGFDIAALWCSFRAFGASPPPAVLVMGYYVGTLGNVLPLPGGIGGVEGGMIGAFLAFGVKAPLAVLAVLAYRTISYWLPTIPGAIAYVRLRRTVAGWRGEGQRPGSGPGPGPEPGPSGLVA